MENTNQSEVALRFRVGLFTVMGLLLLGALTVFVNNRPFWWRPCTQVKISITDATGLQPKSEVRSLGLQIGYLETVELYETHVRLGICVTAPVELLPTTQAYIKGEGFLGDKFVELKPVRYIGDRHESEAEAESSEAEKTGEPAKKESSAYEMPILRFPGSLALRVIETGLRREAFAEEAKTVREIPVGSQGQDIQAVVTEVEKLVTEVNGLATNLKEALGPEELKKTVTQLNIALENASKTLSPEGNLTTTAQRTLAKLEDSIEHLRDLLTRINQGKGSIGRIMNDEVFAEELEKAIKSVNRLLDKTVDYRFNVDLGAARILQYEDSNTRAYFQVELWPTKKKFYRVGMAIDPRGSRRRTVTTTTAAGSAPIEVETVRRAQQGILLSAQLGTLLFERWELGIGILYNDGAFRNSVYLWYGDEKDRLKVTTDVYTSVLAQTDKSFDIRNFVVFRPFSIVYVQAGLDSIYKVNGNLRWSFGAGINFNDDDIKILFAFL